MSKERKPEDMICPLYKMGAIMSGYINIKNPTPPDIVKITCDGEECGLWSKGSGVMRCGLRNI